MLKYLIIQLDDSSVSFCHYDNDRSVPRLISADVLREAIFWSMKENLTLQFLYPDHVLPDEYKEIIAKTYHADIVSSLCEDELLRTDADVVVFDTWTSIDNYPLKTDQAYVVRTSFKDMLEKSGLLNLLLPKVNRLNVVITDVESFRQSDENLYRMFLDRLSSKVTDEYRNGHGVQINLLTDRLFLDEMNNCNAGVESVTLCPDGKFYICPAFYADKDYSVGDLKSGLDIKNPQLYRLDHAPICRTCDAWQCRRCVWLNRKMTLEVNTPSHEQCVITHLERKASGSMLSMIREIGEFLPDKKIEQSACLDPFEKLID